MELSMKKIEVIFEAVYLDRLLRVLEKHEIRGYTLIRDIEGCGLHGLRSNDGISEVSGNDYIFAVCEPEKLEHMKEEIGAFIKRYGGKCFVSDVTVL